MNEQNPHPSALRTGKPAAAAVDCWDRIGVGGDRTCPELEQYVHCRSCPAYAGAGARLLDRELPPGYREEWTRRFAEVKVTAAAKKESVVIFQVGDESLALPTRVFQEVAERRVIRSLPCPRQEFILGLANVRGELLLCLSLEHLLRGQGVGGLAGRRTGYGRLMIARRHGFRLAFPVDKVYGVHRFHGQEIREKPMFVARAGAALVRGTLNWAGQIVGLLDEERLFEVLD